MSFHIGQKVVCVDDCKWLRNSGAIFGDESIPAQGAQYTIRAFTGVDEDGDEFYLLCEIKNPERDYNGDFGELEFWAAIFRPLEEKPDSIEIFREIARGVSDGKPVVEDAEYRLPTPEKVRA